MTKQPVVSDADLERLAVIARSMERNLQLATSENELIQRVIASHRSLSAQLAERDAEIERLRPVVEWYANDDNWQNFEGDGYLIPYDNDEYQPDNGKRAKAALAPHAAPGETQEKG